MDIILSTLCDSPLEIRPWLIVKRKTGNDEIEHQFTIFDLKFQQNSYLYKFVRTQDTLLLLSWSLNIYLIFTAKAK